MLYLHMDLVKLRDINTQLRFDRAYVYIYINAYIRIFESLCIYRYSHRDRFVSESCSR